MELVDKSEKSMVEVSELDVDNVSEVSDEDQPKLDENPSSESLERSEPGLTRSLQTGHVFFLSSQVSMHLVWNLCRQDRTTM